MALAIDDEILQEFLTESFENLTLLDQHMVELERQPDRQDLLAGVFRTIHTIKGTCGFFGFTRLESLTHITEDILNELRQGRRKLDPPLATLILEAMDAVKRILNCIQAGGTEGEQFEDDLIVRLRAARDGGQPDSPPATSVPSELPALVEILDVPEPGKGPSPARQNAVISNTGIRVDVGLLDRLMNLVGELVLTRNQVLQFNSAREDAALNAICQKLNLITTELQEGVMKTRMQPIGVVWNKLPRIVRDLARSLGKEVELQMEGAETELDRTIIEAIKGPLTHIVRNCCDHGIEDPRRRLEQGKPAQGLLALRAWHEGGQVNIEISDDGAGIDPQRVVGKAVERRLITEEQAGRMSAREAVNLVFLPGFSTATTVTNVSGRGVGMDVVKTHIERIGGAVELLSTPGHGTTVRVRIPLTLAIIPGLVVWAGGERFVIPQINLHELIRVEGDEHALLEHVHSTPVLRRRDSLLPVAHLTDIFKLPSRRPQGELSVVVLQAEGWRFGLVVDQIGDSQEIVVKPMGQQMKGLACYAGATIMGDGRIALILDVMGIGALAGLAAPHGPAERAQLLDEAPALAASARRSLLLCRAGAFGRLALPLARVSRLEKIQASTVEWAAGRAAVQYRNRILPLLNVAEILGGVAEPADVLSVIVYRDRNSEFGLVVDEICDIIEESIGDACASERAGLFGSAIVGGRVTDFLDVDAVAQRAGMSSLESLERLRQSLAVDAGQTCLAEVTA